MSTNTLSSRVLSPDTSAIYLRVNINMIVQPIMYIIIAVSYTHLDVYKRQSICSSIVRERRYEMSVYCIMEWDTIQTRVDG